MDKRLVATDAVAAYVYGTPETGFASYFSSSATHNQARNQYTDQIVGNLTKDETSLEHSETRLQTEEAQQQTVAAQAQSEAAQAKSLAQANEQEAAATKATLSQVQGQLAQEVAQAAIEEAQQEAAAAAAAANAAQQQQAAAAAAGGGDGGGGGRRVVQRGGGDRRRQPGRRHDGAGRRVVGGQRRRDGGGAGGGLPARRALRLRWRGGRRRLRLLGSRAVGLGAGGRVHPEDDRDAVARPCTHVSLDALEPGDLLFYYNLDGDNQVDHVVMYTGSGPYGTDTVIQAPSPGPPCRTRRSSPRASSGRPAPRAPAARPEARLRRRSGGAGPADRQDSRLHATRYDGRWPAGARSR